MVMELSAYTLIVAVPDSVLPAGCGFSFAAASETVTSFTIWGVGTTSFFSQDRRKIDKMRDASNAFLKIIS
jgi:hypothetical protein